jgi:hypothetical protein
VACFELAALISSFSIWTPPTRPKLECSAKFADKDLCDKCCFDPSYRLNERASSILDWERRQIERVATEKGLKITQIWDQGYTAGERTEAGWYGTPFETEVVINKDAGFDVLDDDEWADDEDFLALGGGGDIAQGPGHNF